MKQLYISSTIFLIFLFSPCSGLMAQNVHIPDPAFKGFLVGSTQINTNGDSEIQISEASAFSGPMFITHAGINDLTGIEAFTSITDLHCYDNAITSLDLSSNLNLTTLDCKQNQLVWLNIANGANQSLNTFNATGNPNLTCIQVDDSANSTMNWTNIDPQSYFSNNCTNTIGLDDIGRDHILAAFPSPTKGKITISLSQISSGTVKVNDMLGRLVVSETFANKNELTLEIKGSSGIYHCVIRSHDGSLIGTNKIIKE